MLHAGVILNLNTKLLAQAVIGVPPSAVNCVAPSSAVRAVAPSSAVRTVPLEQAPATIEETNPRETVQQFVPTVRVCERPTFGSITRAPELNERPPATGQSCGVAAVPPAVHLIVAPC